MYESFWKLSGKPFGQRMEPGFFYRSQSHHSALLRLKYSLDNFPGPGLIIGLSGTGKSSLVRTFAAEQLAMRPFVHVVFPALECDELLRMIASELSGSSVVDSAPADSVLRDIQRSLRSFTALGQQPLLCLDDAHLLSDEALQYVVQPLINLAENDAEIRLSVLLVGLPVLASRLRRMGELNERIAVTTPVAGFTATETADYVAGCLRRVSGRAGIFSSSAVQRLHQVTTGNPRRINRLCDMALLVGFAEQLEQITESQIDAVSSELVQAAA